ncbi:TRAP-type mannitol/chloroaromatic compound transport system, periplasmic component [Marinibacterium anthonyi]|nr:TRAP-type mannitol/chloroaromatic compound transport system, periplasmic component [Marinibacterium anthonyi]
MNGRFRPAAGGAAAILALTMASGAFAADYKMNIQTAIPNSSLYFGLLEDFAERVDAMSGGRLEVHVLPAGAEVGPFEILDAVSNCVVEAGYAWPHYWSGKHPAYVLFSNVPASTGMDQDTLMAWYYKGGGKELYDELTHDIMGLYVKTYLMQPMGPDPLGWFSKPFESMADFQSIKYRSPPGIAGQTYSAMGVPAVAMPGGDIVPAAQRGTIDAAEWIGPADDRNLGLDKIWDYYYLQGLHQQTDVGELMICQDFYDDLPADLQAILDTAVMANTTMTQAVNLTENSVAVNDYSAAGINVLDAPEEYYTEFLEKQKDVVQSYIDDDEFFAKVYKSQADFAKMVYPYHSRVQKLQSEVVNGAEKIRDGE